MHGYGLGEQQISARAFFISFSHASSPSGTFYLGSSRTGRRLKRRGKTLEYRLYTLEGHGKSSLVNVAQLESRLGLDDRPLLASMPPSSEFLGCFANSLSFLSPSTEPRMAELLADS